MPNAPSPDRPLVDALARFWFRGLPAERLALLRIAVGLFALVYHLGSWETFWRPKGAVFFAPVGPLAFLDAPPSPDLVLATYCVGVAASVAFVLGFRHAVSGPLFAVTFTLLTTYHNSWSMIYHSENLAVWQVVVLAFAPSADVLSLDAREGRTKRRKDGHYGWAVRLVIATAVACYFLAGVAKVAGDLGLDWAHGAELRKQVGADALRKHLLGDRGDAPPIVGWTRTWLYSAIGVLTLVVEIGAPIALFHRRIGMVWAVLVWMMHFGILIVMGIVFRYPLTTIPLLAFFPIERAIPWARARLAGGSTRRASG